MHVEVGVDVAEHSQRMQLLLGTVAIHAVD